jgi:hypothetical protein
LTLEFQKRQAVHKTTTILKTQPSELRIAQKQVFICPGCLFINLSDQRSFLSFAGLNADGPFDGRDKDFAVVTECLEIKRSAEGGRVFRGCSVAPLFLLAFGKRTSVPEPSASRIGLREQYGRSNRSNLRPGIHVSEVGFAMSHRQQKLQPP